jgi:hypothetical protein
MLKVLAPTIIETRVPTTADDFSASFRRGFRWINTSTNNEYICVDDTNGVANWQLVGVGGNSNTAIRHILFSPVDWFVLNASVAPTTGSGNFTVGLRFIPYRAIKITGIRFYWASAGNQTINCKLWDNTASEVATISVVTSGIGYYTTNWTTSYNVPSNKVNLIHYVSIRDNAGSTVTKTTSSACSFGTEPSALFVDPGIRYETSCTGYYSAGDAKPTSFNATERYPVELVYSLIV